MAVIVAMTAIVVLFGLAAYGTGVTHGIRQTKELFQESEDDSKDALFGAGVEDDTPVSKRTQLPIQGDRGFWA